jgi:hypothetical protein
VEGLDAELRAAGTSIAELKRRAQEFGITITDAKGRISALGLKELNDAIELTIKNLTTFKDNLEDQSFLAGARRDIFDNTDAAAVGRDWLDQLRAFAPDLFKRLFAGADTATKEGRERFEEGIRQAFDLVSKNLIPPELLLQFGGAKGFVDFLLDADHALDDFTSQTKEATGEMVNVVRGFRDFNLERARFNATANDTRIPTIPRPAPTPIPTGTAVTSVGTVSFSPTINLHDVNEKDAVELTTEMLTELRRRARASSNPQTRKLIDLLPV